MAGSSSNLLLALGVLVVHLSLCFSITWPVPYKRYESRPMSDPFCKALYPYCPTGLQPGVIPPMADNDTVEVFVLKAPVWEFKFGDLLGKFYIMHDAIGFRSVSTGLNFTTEWYELFQLFNCTFPHTLSNRPAPLWCNQGAACFYPGINDKHWKENGTLEKVAEMTGAQFNKLAQYILWDNHTGLFYETWRVKDSDGPSATMFFEPYDCASYVVRVFQQIVNLGGTFLPEKIGANYSFLTLYSNTPQYLGNDTTIFGENGNKTLASKIWKFYTYFQAHQPILKFAESLLEIIDYVYLKNEFYLYYNSEYWYLPMKKPHFKFSYEFIPFKAPN